MPDKKTSRTARIKERIAETTAKAKENFIPVESGPDPRLHRSEVNHAVHQEKLAAAGSFEESFDFSDPNSERYLPEGMDGVIQIKTASEVAGEEAYAKALKDPLSVLAPRQKYDSGSGRSEANREHRTIVDAGHELAKKQVTEAHDPERIKRVREGISLGEDGSDPLLGGRWAADGSGLIIDGEADKALTREETGPHAESLGCAAGCGKVVTHTAGTVISRSGKVYHRGCAVGVNLDD